MVSLRAADLVLSEEFATTVVEHLVDTLPLRSGTAALTTSKAAVASLT